MRDRSTRAKQHKKAYDLGVSSYRSGLDEENPWGSGDLRLACAFSAGWFDAKRGLVDAKTEKQAVSTSRR